MNRKFYNIYNDFFSDYVFEYGFSHRRRLWYGEYISEQDLIRLTRRIIEDTEFELIRNSEFESTKMRPDAKFFLLSNFHLMVLLPLIESENRRDLPERQLEKLLDFIRIDLKQIMYDAFLETRKMEKNEISGHTIMKTIDKNWKELKLSSMQIWGGDE
jgi:hypothetical protein